MEMTNFTVVRAVLHTNYWSRNLIGPYCFWVISLKNSTSFTRPFLARRHVWAGHETTLTSPLVEYITLPTPNFHLIRAVCFFSRV